MIVAGVVLACFAVVVGGGLLLWSRCGAVRNWFEGEAERQMPLSLQRSCTRDVGKLGEFVLSTPLSAISDLLRNEFLTGEHYEVIVGRVAASSTSDYASLGQASELGRGRLVDDLLFRASLSKENTLMIVPALLRWGLFDGSKLWFFLVVLRREIHYKVDDDVLDMFAAHVLSGVSDGDNSLSSVLSVSPGVVGLDTEYVLTFLEFGVFSHSDPDAWVNGVVLRDHRLVFHPLAGFVELHSYLTSGGDDLSVLSGVKGEYSRVWGKYQRFVRVVSGLSEETLRVLLLSSECPLPQFLADHPNAPVWGKDYVGLL